ncbi:unnamed protein product [Dicrocoelium dendriticum]|nr:unnamed protein product [Dicrocoelium dendriticum]
MATDLHRIYYAHLVKNTAAITMNESVSTSTFFSIPKLQSIVSVLLGVFCILCFKLLIGFGRKWRNILIDWGYRSLNIPSLWSKDTIVDENAADVSSPLSVNQQDRDYRDMRRVPALRLPDAWPNFLLTWMYLNSEAVSGLIPVWLAAINQELIKLTSNRPAHACSSTKSPSPLGELRLTSIGRPSAPPRLSFIETSASGSTKELHFHCTLSSPEIFLDLVISSQPGSTDCGSPEESYMIHLEQVSCRIELICAVLEGDYVLLSWKIVSPLLTQSLSVLDSSKNPITKLSGTDVRWIKDTVYLGIQSAVTRIVLNPLCFTPVQQSLPTQAATKLAQMERSAPISMLAPVSNERLVAHRSRSASISNSMYVRVLYAFLLDSASDSLLDAIPHLSLRCEIRSNNLGLPKRTVIEDGALSDVLMTTRGVRLETKSWPGNEQSRQAKVFLNGRLQACGLNTTVVPRSYVAVWNEDAYIPLDKVASNLLDVVLFMERDGSPSITLTHLSGCAVLPLPKFMEDPSQSQHVLLIECSPSSSTDDWNTVNTDTTVCSTAMGVASDIRAKFMLILRIQLLADLSLDSDSKVQKPNQAESISHSTPIHDDKTINGRSDNNEPTRSLQESDDSVTETHYATGLAPRTFGTKAHLSNSFNPNAPPPSSDVQSVHSFPTYCTFERDSPMMRPRKRKLLSFRQHRKKHDNGSKTSFNTIGGTPASPDNVHADMSYSHPPSETSKEDTTHPPKSGSSRLRRLFSRRSFRTKRNTDRRALDIPSSMRISD